MIKKLMLLFLLLAACQVKAGDELSPKPLLIVTENWLPYNYLGTDGVMKGSATEVVKKVLHATGINYTIKVYPWARAYQLALSQPNVVIYSIIKTPERAPLFHWLCPLIKVKYYIFKLADRDDININNFNDLKNYKQGVSRSSFFYHLLVKQRFVEGVDFHVASNNLVNLRELLHQRIDVFAGSKQFIHSQLKKLNVPINKIQPVYEIQPQMIGEICMAISLKTPQQRVDKIMQAYQKLYIAPN